MTLILRYSIASPYARKVRLAAACLGLSDKIEVADVDLLDPADSIRVQNPLGKIPTLVLEDGATLFDSRVIVEYLDHLAGGGRLIPIEPAARFAALRLQALADGVCDAALLMRYEIAMRPEALRWADWLALQQGKIDRALQHAESAPPQGPRTVGDVALAAALGYLDLRFAGAWRASYPKLVAWLDGFAAEVPAFDATKA
jgi:glutathione S-transferase